MLQDGLDRQARRPLPGPGLPAGESKPAHCLSPEQRQVSAQMGVRATRVQMRIQIINQLGALLLGQAYRVGSGAVEPFQKRLEKLDLT